MRVSMFIGFSPRAGNQSAREDGRRQLHAVCPTCPALLASRPFQPAETLPMARKKAAVDFEQSLAELQTLVERLENGELSLEDSLTAFEQGIRLTRECQGALAQAEQKVQILLERDGELEEAPFDADEQA